MKTYGLSIIDSEGETILDKEISPEEVIQMLVSIRNEAPAEEVVEVKEDAKPGKKTKTGSTPGKRKCGKCGKPGHIARKCTQDSVEIDLDANDENRAYQSNLLKIVNMYNRGASESEIYAAMHDHMTDTELRKALDQAKSKAFAAQD